MANKNIPIFASPLCALVLFFVLRASGIEQSICLTLAITLLTAIWWVTEALPIPATSLVPFVLFPLFGVLTHKEAAAGLGAHVILLLMGGFMIAKGLEKSNLHERMALNILEKVGARGGKGLVFAFMISGALLSMWISNTATCLVLMPIAMAVLSQLNDKRMYLPVILGIAFSCNLGGIATLVGTPPNLIFAGVYEEVAGKEFGFMQWMKIGLPVVMIGLPLMALWLTRNVTRGTPIDLPKQSAWATAEKRVLCIFGVVVGLWVFRLEPFGGWSGWLNINTAGDSTVALLGVVLMFLIPSGSDKGERLLDWKTATDIPWGMLLLFAGGITIAKAFQVSGTAEWIGGSLSATTQMHPFLLILSICLAVTFLTEITSNTATTTLLMPILAAAATSASLPIELMMVPAAMSASCAFMLPVATAPNAIAYGSGHVSMKQMAREGVVLNLIMALVISASCYLVLT